MAKYSDEWISSTHLARSVNINPALIRKELTVLKAHNLIVSKEGKYGGVKLAKPANEILLAEIFKIIKGKKHILEFSKNEGNKNCPVGSQIKTKLDELYEDMDVLILTNL
ncbi:MAG: Rrf2 family transcriptional regulator, partial [Bacteroidota bacterium]